MDQEKLQKAYTEWKQTMDKDVPSYLASLTPIQREAEKVAREMLGTSYFIEHTHGFQKWKAAQKK
jgi:hypothetical protein